MFISFIDDVERKTKKKLFRHSLSSYFGTLKHISSDLT